MRGRVLWFSEIDNFGFIKEEEGGGQIFFHYNDIDVSTFDSESYPNSFKYVSSGTPVEFNVEVVGNGARIKAVQVKLGRRVSGRGKKVIQVVYLTCHKNTIGSKISFFNNLYERHGINYINTINSNVIGTDLKIDGIELKVINDLIGVGVKRGSVTECNDLDYDILFL